ncbi:MAG TPA: hypothetical protein VMD27_09425 [Candidatus Aquilonibacter sp.]|nr:hypothetical protein [Candidatus Aquilonibacter sp.]
MAKPLPNDDFRAVRIALEPSDFALGSEIPDLPPKDLISKETWNHLVGLPDDVAIRTSNKSLEQLFKQALSRLSSKDDGAK